MSLFRTSFINTGPKAPPRKKTRERNDGRNLNGAIEKPRGRGLQNGEQKRHRLLPQPVGEVKDRPDNLYRVVCRVTNDEEGGNKYFRFDKNKKAGIKTEMPGPPQNSSGKTPFLVETDQYFGHDKFGPEYKYCLFDYMALFDNIELLSTKTRGIRNPNRLIEFLYFKGADLFNEILSSELLMVSVELFKQLEPTSRRQLASMFGEIYIISFDIVNALDE